MHFARKSRVWMKELDQTHLQYINKYNQLLYMFLAGATVSLDEIAMEGEREGERCSRFTSVQLMEEWL